MSVESVKKLYEAVSQDESLKQKFVELSQKYKGEALDADKVAVVVEQEVLPLAKQVGYSFSIDDLKTYGEEMQQANINRELSDSELEAVVGGNSGVNCFAIGVGSGGGTGFCFVIGYGSGSDGSNMCLVAGIS